MVVTPCDIFSSASYTMASLFLSSAEVASSSSRILGFLIVALAMAILCFCPPLSCPPYEPTTVFNPSGNELIKSHAFASLHASLISSSVASSFPKRIFSLMLMLKSTGSCPTYPITFFLSPLISTRLSGAPPMVICPAYGS